MLPAACDALSWDNMRSETKSAVIRIGYRQGVTITQLAERFGCSRGAIAGHADRKKIYAPNGKVAARVAAAEAKAHKVKRLPGAKDNGVLHGLRFVTDPAKLAAAEKRLEESGVLKAFEPDPVETYVSMMELTDSHCRWPIDVNGKTMFCGKLPNEGEIYCPACRNRAYTGVLAGE